MLGVARWRIRWSGLSWRRERKRSEAVVVVIVATEEVSQARSANNLLPAPQAIGKKFRPVIALVAGEKDSVICKRLTRCRMAREGRLCFCAWACRTVQNAEFVGQTRSGYLPVGIRTLFAGRSFGRGCRASYTRFEWVGRVQVQRYFIGFGTASARRRTCFRVVLSYEPGSAEVGWMAPSYMQHILRCLSQ